MKSTILAAIMGLCIGDALGLPAEFASREKLRAHPVTGMRGGGVHRQPPGTWSDDSSMALCLLDSLAHGLDYADIMRRFVSWAVAGQYTPYGQAFGIGRTTMKALVRYEKGTEPLLCGGVSERDNGNGSLMRILPLIFYLHSPQSHAPTPQVNTEAFFHTIHNVSALTHAHPRCLIACGIYLCIANALLVTKQVNEAVGAGLLEAQRYYEGKEKYAQELHHFERLLGGAPNGDFARLPEESIHTTGYVVDSLEAALWCLLNTQNYAECVLQAVNLGGDTDTIAAICGGLAGIAYGYQNIPVEWVHQLARHTDIETMCAHFYGALYP